MRKKGKTTRETPRELSTVAVATRALTKAATGEPGARARRSAVQLAGASAARAALGGHPPVEAVMLALFGGLGVLLGFSLDAAIDARKERGRAFVDGLREAYARDDADADAIDEVLQERARDPVVAEAIFEAVKRFFDAPSAEAAPTLGRLLGEYIRDKREADHVFRGVARLLADLSTDEIRTLRALAQAVQTWPWETTATHVHIATSAGAADEVWLYPGNAAVIDRREGRELDDQRRVLDRHTHARLVALALRARGLGDESHTFPVADGPGHVWTVEAIVGRPTLDTIARILK